VAVPLEAVQAIHAHQPLTNQLAQALNREVTADSVAADAFEIGYP